MFKSLLRPFGGEGHHDRTFGRGGIHPESHKNLTADSPIVALSPAPQEVVLPLSQHIGEPARPIVEKGTRVVRGQKIAEGGATGVPIHASITGKLKPIDRRPHPTLVSAESMAIKSTGEAEELEFPEDPDWRRVPTAEALERIREAGIVGLGGAAFPTWRKLQLPPGARVDTLVINGAECEPYLTSDYRTMLAHPLEVMQGALAMAHILGVPRLLFGIEADKRAVVEPLQAAAREAARSGISVDVVTCVVRYPQGAEKQLVTALTGRVIPPRALPSAVGVIVQNVATSAAVYDALRYRKPLLDRVMTVTGEGIRQPRNVLVPLGTPLHDIVNFCGGLHEGTTRIVAGGPMMGRTLPRLDLPVIKGMNGLVLLMGRGPFEEGYDPCVSCGRCLEACPLGLEPDQVSLRIEAGRPLETAPFGPTDCYECGCCTYVCPSGRPLLQFMQVGKAALRRASLAVVKSAPAAASIARARRDEPTRTGGEVMSAPERPFVISPGPHIRVVESTTRIMWTVNASLAPAALWGIFVFGLPALSVLLAAVAGAVGAEYFAGRAMKSRTSVRDGSAVCTGLLLAMTLPPLVPFWMAALGAIFAILFGKMIFGGLGFNLFNPALIGRAFMMATFPLPMSSGWAPPRVGLHAPLDALTTPTPLGALREHGLAAAERLVGGPGNHWFGLALGFRPGSIGEVSAVLILLGAGFLLARGIIRPTIPLAVFAGVALSTAFSGHAALHLLTGGLWLGAFYMATDYVTSPNQRNAQIVFGLVIGGLTGLIRLYGGYPEGICYAILLANTLVPALNTWFKPRRPGLLQGAPS